jgi:hypothetical protein
MAITVATIDGLPPVAPSPTDSGSASTTGSIWNHFGRMGLTSVDDNGRQVAASYDYAFYYVLHLSETLNLSDMSSRLVFPVNPEEITLPRQRSSSGIDVVGGRQRSQMGQVQLRSLTLTSFFPATFDPDYCRGNALERTPEECRAFIENTMNRTDPVYLSVQPEAAPIDQSQSKLESMTCFVTNFSVSRKAGHPLDLFYDLELTEYVEQPIFSQTFTRSKAPRNPVGGKKHPNDFPVTTTKGAWGSTFAGIAGQFYGKDWAALGGKWLMSQNKDVKKANGKKALLVGDKLKPGQKVIVSNYGGVQGGRPNIANVNVF